MKAFVFNKSTEMCSNCFCRRDQFQVPSLKNPWSDLSSFILTYREVRGGTAVGSSGDNRKKNGQKTVPPELGKVILICDKFSRIPPPALNCQKEKHYNLL